jgi:hypothetical protein
MNQLRLKKIPVEKAKRMIEMEWRACVPEQDCNEAVSGRLMKLALGFALWGIPVTISLLDVGKSQLIPGKGFEEEIAGIIAVYNDHLARTLDKGLIWRKKEVYWWTIIYQENPAVKLVEPELTDPDFFAKKNANFAITDLEAAETLGRYLENLPPYFDWNNPF